MKQANLSLGTLADQTPLTTFQLVVRRGPDGVPQGEDAPFLNGSRKPLPFYGHHLTAADTDFGGGAAAVGYR